MLVGSIFVCKNNKKTIAYNTKTCYNVDIGKEVKPLKRKKIKKWLPLVIAIIQLATAVITAINKE
jgi:hypothetical protein|nr:MAG TPA: hypothetical protein [Caudoviricetes sp.]